VIGEAVSAFADELKEMLVKFGDEPVEWTRIILGGTVEFAARIAVWFP
jgi:hypothetical protein